VGGHEFVDPGRVQLGIRPGADQVLGAQRRVSGEEGSLRCAKPSSPDEKPDWNAGSRDARFAAGHRRVGIDAGHNPADLPGEFLQQPGFLTGAHSSQRLLNSFESRGIGHARVSVNMIAHGRPLEPSVEPSTRPGRRFSAE
jgi:hypothetical protein